MEQGSVKVLIVAQNASAKFGGEAFLPLKYFQLLKEKGISVKMIAHSRNQEELEELLRPYLEDIYYVKDKVIHHTIFRMRGYFPKVIYESILGNILGIIDGIAQWKIIRSLIKDGEVDLIHQPIPVSPRAPSVIFGLGVPVIVGPMNGGMNYPPEYTEYQSKLTMFFVSALRKLSYLANIIIPGKRRAALLLVANDRTLKALPLRPKCVERIVENGVDKSIWQPSDVKKEPCTDEASEFHLAFVGRLIPLKGLKITLRAIQIARRRGTNVTFHIIGTGPERSNIEDYACALDLSDNIKFYGFKNQLECVSLLQSCDALILNSLRECGGAVVLEAMSLGLPAIVSDWGGPADYVDSACGILVSPSPKHDFDLRLADAIELLANDPCLRARMGEAGIRRVNEQFDWDKKIDQMLEIYRVVLEKS